MIKKLGNSLLHGLIVMALMGAIGFIANKTAVLRNVEFLNPIEQAFDDFDLTDIVFSKLTDRTKADTNITVVNIGNLDRAGIAEVINIINQNNPKAIGIDVQFEFAIDSTQDALLENAVANAKNVVMVSKMITNPNPKIQKADHAKINYHRFTKHTKTAFANFITKGKGNQQGLYSVRSFSPKEKVSKVILSRGAEKFDTVSLKEAQRKDTIEYAFAVQMAKYASPKKVEKFLARKRDFEWINFRGNVSIDDHTNFNVLDVDNVFASQANEDAAKGFKNVIKDKIVLLGFMGANLQVRSFDDKLFTPLNENYIGRSAPDMYGVVVHANIVSMILNESYISETPQWVNYLISFFIVLFTIMIFSYIFIKVGIWYDALTIFIQLLIVLGLVGLMLAVFSKFSTKMDLGIGLIGIVLSGIFVEIYHGFIRKLFGWRPPNERKPAPQTTEEPSE
ncbi:MAG TPA: hypothetical protein DCS93_05620 [Microscillaceae bacterium]|nr:hypothetical protein [Microscillaceae bacterium]